GFLFIGPTSNRAPTAHVAAESNELMKCARVDADVTSATPLAISAGKRPWPATASPHRTKRTVASVRDTDDFAFAIRAIVAPVSASTTPGMMKPSTFHAVALGVPTAPSSLMVFTTCEYDGLNAASATEAAQNRTKAPIPKNPTKRRFITSVRRRAATRNSPQHVFSTIGRIPRRTNSWNSEL